MAEIEQVEEKEVINNESLENNEDEILDISFEGESLTPNEDEEEIEEESNQTEVFKNLRNKYKETSKEFKALKRELELLKTQPKQEQQQVQEDLTLPNKPKLEDFDYDEEKFSQSLDNWYAKKIEVDSKKKEIESKQQAENERWANKIASYQEETKKLNVSDYKESESMVTAKLSGTQQGILIEVAKNSAQLVYALGKSSKLNDLAKIENPVLFAAEVARLETQIKVNNKTQKSPPAPEKRIIGNGVSTSEARLSQLRAKAETTGDWTEYIKAKNKK